MSLSRDNRERIQRDAVRIAQLEARLKLIGDRAQWAIECAAEEAFDIYQLATGLVAQHQKIVDDVKGVQ